MGKSKRGFGQLTRLPSGRIRARYTGPDGQLHNAPATFETNLDAEAWLTDERRLVASGAWSSPKARAEARYRGPKSLTFGEYADAWLRDRTLKPRTRSHYRSLLDRQLFPTFASLALPDIGPEDVRRWHALAGPSKPTLRAHAYGLLRTILAAALSDQLIAVNPCTIRGAGNSTRVHKIKPATLPELETITAEMPERLRLMVLLASWCGLRFGELAELRRNDVDTRTGVIRVRRGVVRAGGQVVIGTPKTNAGIRDVAIPPHLLPMTREHLLRYAQPGKDGLLFPARDGGHLATSSLYGRKPTKKSPGWGFYRAREIAGRPDLRWHDLRHTGAVLAAQTGATLAELMGRLGHSTPGAALRYQHAAEGRDLEIARRLSALVEEPR
ncbi:MAG TPA: site-specific integrase [Nocardioides sp.]|uniref:tyrosine-type recombinase/integrase n=1 Tax=Nocardioides sp. TaxID=35761 RepID=UPI002F406618